MAVRQRMIGRFLSMVLAVVMLCACSGPSLVPTPMPSQLDMSAFTGIPCAAPCWHGLVIGKSSESNVRSAIPNLTFIDQNSVDFHGMTSMSTFEDPSVSSEGVEIRANCVYGGKRCLTVQVVNHTLTNVEVSLNYGIHASEAIGYLGNPDYVGYRNLGAEELWCEVDLLWIDKQLVLASPIFKGPTDVDARCGPVRDTGKIAPDVPISEVRYWSPPVIQRLRQSAAGEFFRYSGMLPSQ